MKGISGKIVGVVVVVVIIIAAVTVIELNQRPHTSTPSNVTSPTNTTTSTVPPTTSNVTITVVTFSGQSAQFIQYAGQLFHEEHPNVYVQVIQFPFSEYINKELTALEAHSTQYDIIGFTSTSAQRVSPYLLPLNDFNLSGLIGPQEDFGGVIYNVSTGKEETVGVVYETAVYLMAFRNSIFYNQTLAQEFQSQYHVSFNPLTWQNWTDVIMADQFLTSNHVTQYGFLIDDHVSHGIIDAFPAVYGWYYARDSSVSGSTTGGVPGFNIMFTGFIPNGMKFPVTSFNSTAGAMALATYANLVKYEPSPSQLQISYDNLPEFVPQSAGAFLFTSQLSYLNSSVAQDISLSPLPGGYAETGTDFLGVSQYSTHPQIAEQFLQFLVSPQIQELGFLKFGKFPASQQAFQDLINNGSIPPYQREWLNATYHAALNAWANPPNIPPTYISLISDFNSQVYNYLTGQNTNATQVLQTAAEQWMTSVESYYGA
ncbi:extracellular solute-binding protein [Metallosphaera tengchongensis]|uniref:Extracellular solute-binding protein n=1 Tax=Metallosphaera tengchongensis TaxID=1532350 RepID=A0A6N0NV93_9CREN|nr:extracellular solute-binding protein [Metallosphaera tengchongensis]QKR00125.1 extracellular solute-binding protein [Metallosphaera tengchongensis]